MTRIVELADTVSSQGKDKGQVTTHVSRRNSVQMFSIPRTCRLEQITLRPLRGVIPRQCDDLSMD